MIKINNLPDYIRNNVVNWPNWVNVILLKCNIFKGLTYGFSYLKFSKGIDEINPEKKLLDIVNYAIKNVPYYREKYGNICISSVEEFERTIDFISKDDVIKQWDKFIADGADLLKCNKGTTGGTSGKPLVLLTPKNRYVVDMACTHRQLRKFGWSYDTFAVIRNHKLAKDKDYSINPFMKLVYFDAFRLDDTYVEIIYKVIRRLNIKCIHAYPSSLFLFCKLCIKKKLDLSFIKLCRLTSEQITDEQINLFSRFHFQISCSYAQSERVVLAGNAPYVDDYIVESTYGYCELIDSNSNVIKQKGQNGEIVGTSFNNYYFPLIRYKTGDYSSYTESVEDKPFNKILTPIKGRWQSTFIYCRNGRKLSTASLNLHNDLYEKIDGIQYIQEKIGVLNVLIIKGRSYTDETEFALKNFFQECMGEDSIVNISYVDRLIRQSNGKFLLLISKVKPI